MVMGAALLHAVWNAVLKVNGDRLVAMAVIMSSQSLICLCFLPLVGLPNAQAWPYILSSVALHTGYGLFLVTAYRYGDLSHVYPIARGSAPLIVAVLSAIFIGQTLDRQATLSVLLITLGVMSLALTRGTAGIRDAKPVLFALATGVFIAGYTIVDGTGARLNGSPHSYAFTLMAVHSIPFVIVTFGIRKRRALVIARQTWKTGVAAGVASLLAYWVVIWAMTLAPFALVSALRETSVVFAVVFGVLALKERLNWVRLCAIATTLIGVAMLKASR